MKKLMIAAAAAFCGTVCFGELASANVVGYSTVSPEYTSIMYSIPFNAVGGGDIAIEDIQANFAEDDEIQVSWMDEDGYIQFDQYFFKNALGAIYPKNGWYDGDDNYAGHPIRTLLRWLPHITRDSEGRDHRRRIAHIIARPRRIEGFPRCSVES